MLKLYHQCRNKPYPVSKQLLGHFAKFERLSIREHHVYYLSKKKSFAMMEDLLKSNFKKNQIQLPFKKMGIFFYA